MRSIAAILALAIPLALSMGASPASGDDKHAHVSAGIDSFQVGLSKSNITAPSGSAKAKPDKALAPTHAHDITMNICDLNGTSSCGAQYACPDGSVMKVTYTYSDTGVISNKRYSCPGASPALTTADIDRAFKEIPMGPSPIHVQPPDGETLVNFDTIYFTTPFTNDVTLHVLDSSVAFHITVQKYVWHFGDGHSLTTTDPGAAYPDQTIVHRYLRKGPVSVSLETVYQADYSIDGAAQQHLADTVTTTSAPQQLTVLTATPHLVAD